MRRSLFLRSSILASGLLLIAGCGGSSGGGTGGGGGTNSTTITYTFGGPAPTAVAVKIGTGDFAPASVTNGKLTFTMPDGTTDFSMAFVCPTVNSGPIAQNSESVYDASSLDGTSFKVSCPESESSSFGLLTGNVNSSAFPGANDMMVSATSGSDNGSFGTSQTSGSFSMNAPTGTDNVLLALQDSSGGTIAVKDFSNQTVPGALDSGNTIDFGLADATTFQPVIVLNAPSGYALSSSFYLADSTGRFLLEMNGDTANSYAALPADAPQTGFLYEIAEGARSGGSTVGTGLTTSTPGPVSLTFPTPWSYAGPTPAALPTFAYNYAGFSAQSGISYVGQINWTWGSNLQVIWLFASQNFQAGSSSVAFPDLSSTSGFIASPEKGATLSWSAEVDQSASTSDSFVLNSGTYTVP